jgi:Na+-driven multidrug efflux pump
MVLGNLLLNIVAGIELYFLGRIDVETLAAYSIVLTSLMALHASVHGALINGALAFVSRRCGAREHHIVSEALPGMLVFGTGLFMLFGLSAYASLSPVFTFFGAKAEVLVMAKDYMGIMLITCIFMSFYSVLLGTARGSGDSMTPLKIIGVMAVVNVSANILFIVFMKMGIRGAAFSGLATYLIGATLYVMAFLKGLHGIRLARPVFKASYVRTYASLTWKSVAQNFTNDAGNMLMLRIISGYGNPFIAAYGIVYRFINFLLMVGWPICNSGGVIVGQNLGSRNRERAMATVLESFKLYSWVALPTAAVFFFLSAPVMGVFTADASTAAYGITFMKIVSFSLPFMAAGLAAQSAFTGAGVIGLPTLFNVMTFLIFRLGLALWLPSIGGMRETGIFWAIAASLVFFGAIYWLYYRTEKWTHKEI